MLDHPNPPLCPDCDRVPPAGAPRDQAGRCSACMPVADLVGHHLDALGFGAKDMARRREEAERAQLERWGRTGVAILDVATKPAAFRRCDLPRTATLEKLIDHCRLMPDATLERDFAECVLDETATPLEREQLRLYYRARADHPSFDPRISTYWDADAKQVRERPRTANNHRAVIAAWRDGLAAAEAADLQARAAADRRCECGCGKRMPAGRPDRRFLNATHRKRRSRARQV